MKHTNRILWLMCLSLTFQDNILYPMHWLSNAWDGVSSVVNSISEKLKFTIVASALLGTVLIYKRSVCKTREKAKVSKPPLDSRNNKCQEEKIRLEKQALCLTQWDTYVERLQTKHATSAGQLMKTVEELRENSLLQGCNLSKGERILELAKLRLSLYQAIQDNKEEEVQKLLDDEALDPNDLKRLTGVHPLWWANAAIQSMLIAHPKVSDEVVKDWLAHGDERHKEGAVRYIMEKDHSEAMQVLIRNGLNKDFNVRYKRTICPFTWYAVMEEKENIIRTLAENGYANGLVVSLLDVAVEHDKRTAVRALLSCAHLQSSGGELVNAKSWDVFKLLLDDQRMDHNQLLASGKTRGKKHILEIFIPHASGIKLNMPHEEKRLADDVRSLVESRGIDVYGKSCRSLSDTNYTRTSVFQLPIYDKIPSCRVVSTVTPLELTQQWYREYDKALEEQGATLSSSDKDLLVQLKERQLNIACIIMSKQEQDAIPAIAESLDSHSLGQYEQVIPRLIASFIGVSDTPAESLKNGDFLSR